MIICGFAGIGKSTVAKERAGWVDLESTPFNKNWELYADVAEHMNKNGYNVMLSAHQEIREELQKRNAGHVFVLPKLTQKSEYIERYKQRGNTDQFIKLMSENWVSFCTIMANEHYATISGYLSEEIQ